TFVAAMALILCFLSQATGSNASGRLRGMGPGDGAVDWPTYGFDVERSGDNPGETGITVGNAAQLHEAWSTDLGSVIIAQPVEAAGVDVGGNLLNVIYEGTEHGDLDAVDAATGGVVWRRNLGAVQTGCFDMPDG